MRVEYQLCIAESGINMLSWDVFIAADLRGNTCRTDNKNLRRNQTGVKGQLIGQTK